MSQSFKYCYLCQSSSLILRPDKIRDYWESANLPAPDVLECSNCGLVFLSSFDHISSEHYINSGMHNEKTFSYDSWLAESKIDDKRRFGFLKDKIKGKKLLDFGCGAGGFLNLAKEISKNVDGIELEKALHPKFKERSLNVFYNEYEAIKTKFKWDIISAFHVVEHLKDPLKTLKDLSLILDNNGELIIEVPNINDALLSLYNNKAFKEFNYWSNHLFMFNTKTLKDLVKKAGFEVNWIKPIQRYPLSNHLYWLSHGMPGGHKIFDFIDSQNLQDDYEKKLASVNATDTIMLSASKSNLD
jgi:2-polyprenyl-3-methyl-5-hydroxy-6-metoxy-1,4-benzoquinol methylase